MRRVQFSAAAFFAFTATGLLLGCGGQEHAVPPVGAAGVHPASYNRPLAHGAGRKLLYVVAYGSVNVYTYPEDSLLGSLTGNGNFLCNDQQGDVFVTTGSSLTVAEYAHGSLVPKVSLQDPLFAGPCSVDPTTGSVAVAGFYSNSIVIFPYNKRRGWRFAKAYRVPNMSYVRFCSYDPNGDLFIDGAPSGSGTLLDELPKGGSTFENISLDQQIRGPGGIQWDGTYLAVADAGRLLNSRVVVYRFAISGSSGTLVGSTRLANSYGGAQYWIQGGRVIGQYVNPYDNGVAIWRYPRGGKPIKTFAPQTQEFSAVVSVP